jgi:hypothetical protein
MLEHPCDNHLELDLKLVADPYKDIVHPPGKYRFTILVTTEDAESLTKLVEIDWNGDYKSLSSKLVTP